MPVRRLAPRELALRDGATCWLCGGGVDATAHTGSPWAGSVDHVVPRARGGGDEPTNLRLAHRRCNSARGSRLPELDWPRDVPVVDAAPIWPVVTRALRRRGEWEVVGVVVGEQGAADAQEWLRTAVPEVLGGDWEVRAAPLGPGLTSLALRHAPQEAAPRGRTPGRLRRAATRARATG